MLRAVRAQLPQADLLYFGDNGHIPYGARPLAQVRAFSHAITRFLAARGAQAALSPNLGALATPEAWQTKQVFS